MKKSTKTRLDAFFTCFHCQGMVPYGSECYDSVNHAWNCRACYDERLPIRLLSDNVLIRLLDPERHFHSLWLPETAKREPYELWRGEVIAVGPGARSKRGYLTPCEVKPGDRVQFYWGAGKIGVTEYPDQKHRIIAESQIQAVLEA